MCKLKDAISRAEDVRMHYHISFMEHLNEMMPQQPKLTIEDIEEMERELNSSLPVRTPTIPKSSLNNQYYEPNEENYYAN